MAKNDNLHKAKDAKNDEFYTRIEDVAEELLLSIETMHYSADDEDGVVTVHKYDENGNEVFMREIDKASDMDTVII